MVYACVWKLLDLLFKKIKEILECLLLLRMIVGPECFESLSIPDSVKVFQFFFSVFTVMWIAFYVIKEVTTVWGGEQVKSFSFNVRPKGSSWCTPLLSCRLKLGLST